MLRSTPFGVKNETHLPDCQRLYALAESPKAIGDFPRFSEGASIFV